MGYKYLPALFSRVKRNFPGLGADIYPTLANETDYLIIIILFLGNAVHDVVAAYSRLWSCSAETGPLVHQVRADQ